MSKKIAVISCIHGNMEALETVYDDICSKKINDIVCLGDLVGYGPHPNEVVRFIKRNDISTVLGCWDEGIGLDKDTCGCHYISCLLYTSPSPRDATLSRMPSSA